MKTFSRTFLPEQIKYNGKTWVRNYCPKVGETVITVEVLSKRLRGMTDLYGRPYQPTKHTFTPATTNPTI